MTSFALITEGITDQLVLRKLLEIFFDDEVEVNHLQPRYDETDNKQLGYGNWVKVFDYCQSDDFKDALNFNDFIVVQLDSDVSPETHFDIPHQINGNLRTDDELYHIILAKIQEKINTKNTTFYQENQDKILFAIGIHSIECWLLPLFYTDNRREKTVNCLNSLNPELNKKFKLTIDANNKNSPKIRGIYAQIAEGFKKKSKIIDLAKFNYGFQQFVERLGGIEV